MPEGIITQGNAPTYQTVTDYQTWRDSMGVSLSYPRRVEAFEANEAIAKGDWVSFVAPTATVGMRVEKADTSDTFHFGVALNSGGAGEMVDVVVWGFAICNIGDTTIAAAGDPAIPHASTAGASGSLAFGAESDAPILGRYLSTEIGTTNTAAVFVNPFTAASGVVTFDHIVLGPTYNDSGSFQSVEADLNLGAAAGSEELTDTDFIAAGMFHLYDDDVAHTGKDGNYTAGMIGAYSVAGDNPTDLPKAGVLGIIGVAGEVDDDDVVAVEASIDNSDPDLNHHIRAFFGVSQQNPTGNDVNDVDFGLDLQAAAHAGMSSAIGAGFYDKAPIRIGNDVVWLAGDGAPTDGTTGDNVAGPGSVYTDYTNGVAYIQVSAITTPVWRPISTPGVNAQTGTTYGFLISDAGKTVTLNNGSAITATIPANASVAYPVGTEIDIVQLGAGQVTVAITSDTLNGTPTLKLRAQYSGATLKKIAATTWVILGDLAAS